MPANTFLYANTMTSTSVGTTTLSGDITIPKKFNGTIMIASDADIILSTLENAKELVLRANSKVTVSDLVIRYLKILVIKK